ncbi:MAG: 9-cis-epoxycarotenoid dioxygenase [Spirulina sp. SIO3F2]|nr:9-cis-epoxycarotenoid dioxygenase [Spirulina sp. SIO3F2]
MTAIANPFLQGNFAPIRQESAAENLPVIGEIPPELSGMFVRNGPNPQFDPIGQYHWFDGDGMLHGMHLQDGQATYRNRYVQTRGFLKEQAAQQAIWTGLLEPPQMELPDGPSKNTSNTALVWHSQRLLTLLEAAEPYAIALPSLATCGSYTFNGKLQSPVTAHPKVDPETGEMMFFGYGFAPPYLQYSVVSAAGELLRTVPIDLPVGVMMHDCAITERFTIFLDLPLTFRPERAAQGQLPLAFERDRPSRFGIVPRHGDQTQVRWFEAPACYVFHTLNAYEQGDEVVLIACRMAEYDLTGAATDPDASIPRLYEWRFNLSSGELQERQLSPIPAEFPRINEQYMGRPMRYGFASKMAATPMPLFEGLLKFDFGATGTPTTQVHELGRDRYCGEAVFAPHPDAQTEDEGWLLTFVHDEGQNQSELLIVDAHDLTQEPIARVILPQRVPYGFHGLWVSDAQIQATRQVL